MGVKSRASEELLRSRALDRLSPIPLYYQLARVLQEEIDEGTWAAGDLLPSEALIGSLLQVSRPVVRQALDILQSDGQVNKINGIGSVVAAPKYRYQATAATADWSRIANENSWTVQRALDVRRATAGRHVANLLSISPSDEVFELSAVHALDAEPVSIWHAFVRTDATKALSAIEPASLPELVVGQQHAWAQLTDRYEINLLRSELEIEATLVNEFESKTLDVPIGTPAFLLSTLEVPSTSAPVAFTRAMIRGDHFRYSVILRYDE